MNDSTFAGLCDTPISYSSDTYTVSLGGFSHSGDILMVNGDSTGLEWVTTYGSTNMGSDWDIDKCETGNCRKAQLFLELKID